MKVLYTAEAQSSGDGREGRARTTDGAVDLVMAPPKELGGSGDGANPEQLFATGYAACFHSALRHVARDRKVAVGTSTVTARVGLGPREDAPGFALAVELLVALPDVPAEQRQELVDAAHQVCPYSNATRGNVDVALSLEEL